jgi:hypothetical protein
MRFMAMLESAESASRPSGVRRDAIARQSVIDGPFIETKELIGGYATRRRTTPPGSRPTSRRSPSPRPRPLRSRERAA